MQGKKRDNVMKNRDYILHSQDKEKKAKTKNTIVHRFKTDHDIQKISS